MFGDSGSTITNTISNSPPLEKNAFDCFCREALIVQRNIYSPKKERI